MHTNIFPLFHDINALRSSSLIYDSTQSITLSLIDCVTRV